MLYFFAAALLLVSSASSPLATRSPLRTLGFTSTPTTANCTWTTVTQPLDHFAVGATPGHGFEWEQRVCSFSKFVKNASKPGAIFFYTGNESPVGKFDSLQVPAEWDKCSAAPAPDGNPC